MRTSFPTVLLVLVTVAAVSIDAQTKKPASPAKPKPTAAPRPPEIGQSAVVVDELLSNLRKEPSLFAESIHRMQRGRKVQILGVAEADGVRFFKVTAPWGQDVLKGTFSNTAGLARFNLKGPKFKFDATEDSFNGVDFQPDFFNLKTSMGKSSGVHP